MCIAAAPATLAGDIETRPGVTIPSTALSVKQVSKAGVLIQSGSSTPGMIGWDRVRSITGEHAAEAARFAAISDRLWRLRLRAERDDLILAEPLADALVQELSDAPGPSLSVALATQVACRLRRSARTTAVESWLRWLSCNTASAPLFTDAGPASPAFVHLTIDSSGLIPELHPFWLESPAVRAFAHAALPSTRDAASRLAQLYTNAAAFECSDPFETPDLAATPGQDAAVLLVQELVAARVAADAPSREKARAALTARLAAETVAWRRQWLLAGLGRSLLRETSSDQKLLGVDLLLQVAGDPESPVSDLSATCLAQSLVTLHELGESSGAASLKVELFQRFGSSPVLSWPPLRKVPGAASSASNTSSPTAPAATGGAP